MYIGVHIKYPLFLFEFMKLEFSGEIFEKYSYINFPEDPSSGSRVVHEDGRTDARQT
jgi:hypothetical protein